MRKTQKLITKDQRRLKALELRGQGNAVFQGQTPGPKAKPVLLDRADGTLAIGEAEPSVHRGLSQGSGEELSRTRQKGAGQEPEGYLVLR